MFRNRFGNRGRGTKRAQRSGALGVKIAPHAEIVKLNKAIEKHENDEFEAFEVEFDQKLKQL